MSGIRVLLAEDHTLVRKGIRSLLDEEPDLEVVAEAEDGRDAVAKTTTTVPDVVLMDIAMPGLNGLESTRLIKKQFPQVKVLVLSMHTNEEYILQFLQAGASGYLLKQGSIDDLAETIRAVFSGKAVFSPEVTQTLLRKSDNPHHDYGFTARELEILKLMVEGQSNTDIAMILNISPSTAKFHVGNVLSKLGVSSRVEAVALAVAQNLV